MTRKTLSVRVGSDGVLHVPLGAAEADREVRVTIEPLAPPCESETESRGWPPGYFENTFGSIDDDTFFRHPQGDLPRPVELE